MASANARATFLLLFPAILNAVRVGDGDDDTMSTDATANLQDELLRASATASGINCGNTGFDMMREKAESLSLVDEYDDTVTDKTLLIIVDAQLGFTANHDDVRHGGFAQPCLIGRDQGHLQTIKRIEEEITKVKEANGFIVATKDYHPADHCSFLRLTDPYPCKNSNASANIYAKKNAEVNTSYSKNRYQNGFPVHCVGTKHGKVGQTQNAGDFFEGENYTFDGSHPSSQLAPLQTETNLDTTVWNATRGYDQFYIAYKGFNRAFESFGAFPMEGENNENKNFVGAKVWLEKTGKDLENNVNPESEDFSNENFNRKFQALELFMKTKGINAVRVVGYVYDYCVKETAIGAVQQGFNNTAVILDATRPAVDGLTEDTRDGLTDDEQDGLPVNKLLATQASVRQTPGLSVAPDSGTSDGASDGFLGSFKVSAKTFVQLKQNGVKQFAKLNAAA